MTGVEMKTIENLVEKHHEEIVSFMQDIIRIPSVTGDENPVQELILSKLNKMGLETRCWDLDSEELSEHPAYVKESKPYPNRPNVCGLYHGNGKGKSLLFNGHVDVVPPGDEKVWVHGPWSGDIEDGRIYGRGSSDMKSGAVAMTMALKVLLDEGYRINGDIIFEYVVDEEDTGNGTLSFVQKGYTADAGICCETSSMNVQPGCLGRVWWEIYVEGRPAGIQKHFEGVSGIDQAYKIVEWVKNFERIRMDEVKSPLYPDMDSSIPCMVTCINSGSFCSSFPDSATLKGSFATVPGEDLHLVMDSFVSYLMGMAQHDPWLKNHLPKIEFKGYLGDSAAIPVDSPIVTTLAKNFESLRGHHPVISGRQGAADTRYLINYANVPTVIFGPGLTEQMHSTNEYVLEKDLVDSVKILAATILDWCGYSKS
ncbi:MAG: ArgE/DapE family deacylase [Sphaerochaetaceae bacterium]